MASGQSLLPTQLSTKIASALKQLKLEVTAVQLNQLEQFLALLQKWNKAFNLVADASEDELLYRHLLDCLSISDYLNGSSIVDIGAGAGFPGIPLAIINPDKEFLLIDSNGKKTRFLFQVKLALQLDNLDIENCRIEHYQSDRQIDIVTCRAFSTLEDTVALAASLISESSHLLAMKGRYPAAEIDALPAGFKITKTVRLEVPGVNGERHLLEVVREA